MRRRPFVVGTGSSTPTLEQIPRPWERRPFITCQPTGHIKPPVPYLGTLRRYVYPTQIADYEALSSAAWSTGSFSEYVTFPGSVPTYGGKVTEWYYYVLDVPNEATSDVSVILQPIRYAIEEASAAGGNFDYWRDGSLNWGDGGGGFVDEKVSTRSPLTSPTLLPVSGNSHVENTSPSSVTLYGMPTNIFPFELWDTQTSFAPLFAGSPRPRPKNQSIRPAYIRFRKNGVGYESLINRGDYNEVVDATYGVANYLYYTQGGYDDSTIFGTVYFANSGTSVAVPWNLNWTAGDTLEIDVWYELKARPRAGSGTGQKYVVAAIPRHVVATSARITITLRGPSGTTGVSGASYVEEGGHSFFMRDVAVNLGFDPALHTYSFDHGTHGWHAGDGIAGQKKAEIIVASAGSGLVSYVSQGSYATGTGAITPTLPTGWAVGNLFLLFCETANQTVASPAGWTQVANSPKGTGGGGGAGSTGIAVFYHRAIASSVAPTVADPGDHCSAIILSFTNVVAAGNPWNITGGNVESVATAAGNISAVTTTLVNTLVVAAFTKAAIIGPTGAWDFVNANLTTFTEQFRATTGDGNGGGMMIWSGTMLTAASTGATAVTVAGADAMAMMHIALTVGGTIRSGWTTLVIDSWHLVWSGYVEGGTYDGYKARYDLEWDSEIAELDVSFWNTANVYQGRLKYRPQNSGDYVTTVTDRATGSLVCGPCGVFNGLGTTIFEPWYGTQLAAYAPPAINAIWPVTITVRKLSQ